MLGTLLDIVFPKRCAGCSAGAWPFCESCRGDLLALSPPWCARCGRPTERAVRRCRDCPAGVVDSARAPFVFGGPARAAVHRLKFSGWRAVAAALGAAMVAVNEFDADVVAWVPLSRLRRAERGYDQALALAQVVSRGLDIPLAPLLERTAATVPQAMRAGHERRGAMRGVFRISDRAPPQRVLLVDDVLTTGATAAACAEVLLAAGAHRVGLLTAARALSGRLPTRCYTRPGSRLGLWLPGDVPR